MKVFSLEDILRQYFSYKPSYNPEHEALVERYYDSIKKRQYARFINEQYGIEVRLGHVYTTKTRTSLWMYVADNVIRKTNSKRANRPLHLLADCEYMYYGMYMNCAAFLRNVEQKPRLVLVHSRPQGPELIEFKYRADMARIVIEHFDNSRVRSEVQEAQQEELKQLHW